MTTLRQTTAQSLITLALTLTAGACAHSANNTPAPSYAEPAPSYSAPAPRRADPVALCDAIQRDRDIPVICKTGYVDNVPSMVLGFSSRRRAEAWIEPVLGKVAGPFCTDALYGNRTAYVIFSFYSDQLARGYDCRTRTMTPWYSTAGKSWENTSYR